MNGSGQQYPPPQGYEQPELRDQLQSSTTVLLLVAGLINVLTGSWLWRLIQSARVGGSITAVLGVTGLLLLDLACAGLFLYARRRR